ncbi:MAG: Holliday junction ATP-dependent DNA helicase RuvA [Candidatus Anoxychlamydiales bacterium]|nr:Holliday junction ATP-dependent DNA helicase RuvA [Candidatus Anoxychlamydiales bacterium]NGX40236.1 Holliday junction ATP-dependent DNA helicase RuvA [Candidatus Anoxychlamydiales bacterium]HEU64118.1 Holliday junction branch migration protein RuvA [Chlamydiota bacterium]
MYEYIKGKLIEVDTQRAIIDVNGVGYKVFIPASIYQDLIDKDQITLHTSYIVKEDSQTLFGFLTKLQRNVFEMLTTVSGIGAKTAVLLLGHLEIDNLHIAIQNADIRLISKVPGIGKKTAERLILELRDKFKKINQKYSDTNLDKKTTIASDAIAALMNLGYNPSQAQKAVKSAIQDLDEPDLSSLITKALRSI